VATNVSHGVPIKPGEGAVGWYVCCPREQSRLRLLFESLLGLVKTFLPP
jgi:hypothetical protein